MGTRLILTNCPPEEAEKLVRGLLDRRLIACANVLPGVKSFYWWEGSQECASESVIMLKTTTEKASLVIEAIRELHSYDVPEVLELPIEGGNPDYLNWVAKEVR